MILNITNGKEPSVDKSINNSTEVKPVKIDITDWIEDKHFESDSKLKSL